MRVVIVGAGEVGTAVAENLAPDHHVVIVEQDPDRVDDLTYSLDVLAIQGDGTDIATLREAGIDDADLVIAATDADEVNIVVCGTARTATDAFTVARVKRPSLLYTWQESEAAYGVDFMVSTDLLTAEAIFRISGLPGAVDVDTFASGLIRMAEFEIPADSPLVGCSVEEADQYDSMTVGAIFRGDDFVIVTGTDRFQADDRVVVIGSPDSIRAFAADVTTGGDEPATDIVILGGSSVGVQTARLIEQEGYRPRLVESDPGRARELAEALSKTVVVEGDGTDRTFLDNEHVGDADLVVTCLGSDEKNLLVSLLAETVGVERTVAIVETPAYADLFETVGVDVAIDPREEAAEEIVRFTREGRPDNVAMIENDRGEVLERTLQADSPLVGETVQAAVDGFPEAVVIGAIARAGELVTPRGETVFRAGDHVVFFVATDAVDAIADRI
ncbi:Trk system potassium transporter TrkA [Halococcoides cellulosivorans]|uniref:Trk system potassium transporter TrkA n=1 Tax=Halococcoides cellulosivorans TaxID=1679096 RepID=A0A2R4X1J2_9EURY|nr:Trk system potassium transporter TrkA [Halococcoides cellulosivorans]AWB27662.1 Trk system potassium transporter TrkA [Halococcoides cellulosivorans]